MTHKIYIFIMSTGEPGVIGAACAEDGTMLVTHLSSNGIWSRHDMGLTSTRHHEEYAQYYPEGYELVDLVDLTDEELATHAEFQEALIKGIDKMELEG